MRILSIGNSFSQDAHKWIYPLAKELGVELTAVNLYIGGCSLQRHWSNFLSGSVSYDYERNGEKERRCSLNAALSGEKWDIITLQQVSGDGGRKETYEPYLSSLVHYIRKSQPQAKLYIHQTWAYDEGSSWSGFVHYGSSVEQMYTALQAAYQSAAERISADIIPCGDVMQHLRTYPEFAALTRDGGHLSYLYGRYAAALTWIYTLTGADIRESRFVPEWEGERAEEQKLETLRQAICTVLYKFAKK